MTNNPEIIQLYWSYCGFGALSKNEIESALNNLNHALACGQNIPRIEDKTLAPLYGPRLDIRDNKTKK